MDHLKRKYATPPRKRALVIGCGNGWVERDLADRGVAEHFEAFDASQAYLDQAEALRRGRPIRYFQSDFSQFLLSNSGKYDLIVNVAALHHARRLYRILDVLKQGLATDGIFAHWEYIGPSRNQYSHNHFALMRAVNESLPERFRTPHALVHDLGTFLAGDPTEAVHSAEIARAFADRFDVLEWHPLNGGLAYQLLWNNLAPFRGDEPEARSTLDRLLELDEALTRAGLVPPLFCYFVGGPRSRAAPLRAHADRWLREPLREFLASLTGGIYPSELLAAEHRVVRSRAVLARWLGSVTTIIRTLRV
jgi:SAM-dependent methyltransferase